MNQHCLKNNPELVRLLRDKVKAEEGDDSTSRYTYIN